MKSLSRAAGLGETYVRDLIIGKVRSPSHENLIRISEVLGCKVSDIFQSTDEQPEDDPISIKALNAAASGLEAWAKTRKKRLSDEQFARLLPLVAEKIDDRQFSYEALENGSLSLPGFHDDEDQTYEPSAAATADTEDKSR